MSKSWWKALIPVAAAAAPYVVDYFTEKKSLPPSKDTRTQIERELAQLRSDNAMLHTERNRLLGEVEELKQHRVIATVAATGFLVSTIIFAVMLFNKA